MSGNFYFRFIHFDFFSKTCKDIHNSRCFAGVLDTWKFTAGISPTCELRPSSFQRNVNKLPVYLKKKFYHRCWLQRWRVLSFEYLFKCSPTPSPSPISSLSRSSYVSTGRAYRRDGVGRGWMRFQSYDRLTGWTSINHSILSGEDWPEETIWMTVSADAKWRGEERQDTNSRPVTRRNCSPINNVKCQKWNSLGNT